MTKPSDEWDFNIWEWSKELDKAVQILSAIRFYGGDVKEEKQFVARVAHQLKHLLEEARQQGAAEEREAIAVELENIASQERQTGELVSQDNWDRGVYEQSASNFEYLAKVVRAREKEPGHKDPVKLQGEID